MAKIKRPKPQIVDAIFDEDTVRVLKKEIRSIKLKHFDKSLSRKLVHEDLYSGLRFLNLELTRLARKVFKSKTLVPSYALYARYEGEQAHLFKHVDDNACTYTLDYCLDQNTPWDIWVEDKPYTLQPNQALAFYGNDQVHWREALKGKKSFVEMIFFHFVEPDHWYFSKGPTHYEKISKKNNLYK